MLFGMQAGGDQACRLHHTFDQAPPAAASASPAAPPQLMQHQQEGMTGPAAAEAPVTMLKLRASSTGRLAVQTNSETRADYCWVMRVSPASPWQQDVQMKQVSRCTSEFVTWSI